MKRRLLWQLFPSQLLIIFISLMTYVWLEQLDVEKTIPRAALFGIAAYAAALCAAFVSRLIVEPLRQSLREIRRGAETFSRGELARRLSVPEPREFHELAHTLNRVGVQLKDRIEVAERQRNELNAILGSMREGLIVLDKEYRLIRLNDAAEGLLGISRATSLGKMVYEVIRNVALQRLLEQAIAERRDVESSITLFDPVERSIQVYARVLSDGEALKSVLIVLNDLTHVHRLENVRREFVANVSHELRTPITSIKGFVETLLDGALDNPDEARRFLEIIARQVDRLSAIFDDLLSLSRIEQQESSGDLVFEPIAIKDLLETTIQSFEKRAAERSIELRIEGETGEILINRNLIEQAIGNLIDNALKHSGDGSSIQVGARFQGADVILSVADAGTGMEPEHLTRIFERFYRVDKGRTRKQGGTGLGLSIVKHIAQVHGGSVDVKSQLGEGSTFYLRFPRNRTLGTLGPEVQSSDAP